MKNLNNLNSELNNLRNQLISLKWKTKLSNNEEILLKEIKDSISSFLSIEILFDIYSEDSMCISIFREEIKTGDVNRLIDDLEEILEIINEKLQ